MRRHYTLPPAPYDPEPFCITPDAIADYLAKSERPRMAEHVRRMGKDVVRLNAQVNDLALRMQKYEPLPERPIGPRRKGD